MIRRLSNASIKNAKGPFILLSFLLVLLFALVLVPMVQSKLEASSGGTGFVDMLFSYAPETANAMVGSYGDLGRALYLTFTSTADMIYPVAYSIFFSLLLSWLLQRGFKSESKWQLLNVIPFGVMAFDWLENASLLILLSQYPSRPFGVMEFSSLCTTLKWCVGMLAILVVLLGFIKALTDGFKKR